MWLFFFFIIIEQKRQTEAAPTVYTQTIIFIQDKNGIQVLRRKVTSFAGSMRARVRKTENSEMTFLKCALEKVLKKLFIYVENNFEVELEISQVFPRYFEEIFHPQPQRGVEFSLPSLRKILRKSREISANFSTKITPQQNSLSVRSFDHKK